MSAELQGPPPEPAAPQDTALPVDTEKPSREVAAPVALKPALVLPPAATNTAVSTELEEIEDETASTWPSLQISRPRLKLLEYATQVEKGNEDPNVGFSARLFAQVSVPVRNPGDIPYYERRNGRVVLTMSPALITQKDGTRVRRYPYGIIPRLALTYVTTEAFLSNSPVVDLGSSMRSFLRKLNVTYNGRNADNVKNQLAALFGAQLSVEGMAVTEDGHGTISEYFQIAKSVQLWWTNKDEKDNDGLWSSEVRLSQEFFDSINNSPVPVDLTALRRFAGSAFRIDVYLTMTHRMYYLRKTTRIKWVDLHNQFGAPYGRVRAFRTAFIKVLEDVKIAYPALNAEPTEDYLILRPSLTHIPSNKPYKQVGSKSSSAE
jgi:hypothetical protein